MDGFPLLRPSVFFFRRHSFYFRLHWSGVGIHPRPRQFFCFRRRTAKVPGLQGFAFGIKPNEEFPPPAACLGRLEGGGTRTPGPPRQLASGAWGASFFFRRRSFYFRLLHFPDSRRQTSQFSFFRRRASSFSRLLTVHCQHVA